MSARTLLAALLDVALAVGRQQLLQLVDLALDILAEVGVAHPQPPRDLSLIHI